MTARHSRHTQLWNTLQGALAVHHHQKSHCLRVAALAAYRGSTHAPSPSAQGKAATLMQASCTAVSTLLAAAMAARAALAHICSITARAKSHFLCEDAAPLT
mmetsp:Transcript_6162/g.13612  ORF Transcript_6162/g.13612 Transcript_6162/m.13612 type:complete len:102 (-) Transcript_6162:394-699(-)